MSTRRRKIELNRPSFDGCPWTKMTIEVGYQTCSDCQWITFSDETGVTTIDLAPEDLKALAYLLCTSYIFSNALADARQVIEEGKAPYDVYETTKLYPTDPAEASKVWSLDVKSDKDMTEEKLKKATSLATKIRIARAVGTFAMKRIYVYGVGELDIPEDMEEDYVPFFKELEARYQKEIEEL